MQVTGIEASQPDQLVLFWSEAAARRKPNRARNFILATGGLLGGGFIARYDGVIEEVVCGLPIRAPSQRGEWFNREFFGQEPHPIFTTGIEINQQFQPIGQDGMPIFNNLFIAGTALAHGDFLRERSLDGVGLATGYWIGTHL
ncbi:MAG: hypothetical protein A2W35_12480 [Chloroflexi bacterium RBG_16_57_11]|nr:MAG: hypothetical protein A2W35_12480 [Chloroflexi bacterium RBG_16_57_11]